MSEAATARAPLLEDDAEAWQQIGHLPCALSVELPLPEFRVGDLGHLAPQVVVDAHWPVGHDLPLKVNGQLIAWCEFEVVGNRLAVRLTELA
jgi:flagellar motor switch/type III secretory pathway protein FliN